jgi:hypothetical protein
MGEIRTADGKALQIAVLEFRSTSSQILGFCGRLPGFRQGDRVTAQSARSADTAQLSEPRGASHRTSCPVIAAMRP